MFVWVEVFALIVGLLCACGVRRLYDLMRVCLSFCPILSSFVLFLVLYLVPLLLCLPFFLSSLLLLLSFFLLSLLVLLSSACPLACLVCSCVLVGFVFSFSLSDYTQKERAQFLASSLVLLWLRWLLSCHYNFAGFNSILHACHIVHWNIVPIPSVAVVIEANKGKI